MWPPVETYTKRLESSSKNAGIYDSIINSRSSSRACIFLYIRMLQFTSPLNAINSFSPVIYRGLVVEPGRASILIELTEQDCIIIFYNDGISYVLKITEATLSNNGRFPIYTRAYTSINVITELKISLTSKYWKISIAESNIANIANWT